MKKVLSAAVLASALALTACGSSAPQQPSATSAAPSTSATPQVQEVASDAPVEFEVEPQALTADGDLFAMVGMTAGKFSLKDTTKPDPDLLSWLKKADPEASWSFITLTIDNREGYGEAFNHQIRAYDAAGKEYGFVRPIELLDPLLDEGMPHELYEKLWEKYDTTAHPGAVKKFTMITGDSIPQDLKRVTVSFGGLVGEADAITLDEAKAQGMPVDF